MGAVGAAAVATAETGAVADALLQDVDGAEEELEHVHAEEDEVGGADVRGAVRAVAVARHQVVEDHIRRDPANNEVGAEGAEASVGRLDTLLTLLNQLGDLLLLLARLLAARRRQLRRLHYIIHQQHR